MLYTESLILPLAISTYTKNFESFKNRVKEVFDREWLSESLTAEIERWHGRKYQETDLPGGSIEQRVTFQIELAQIYIATDRNDLAFDTLEDAWDQATDSGLTDLVEKITDLMNSIP